MVHWSDLDIKWQLFGQVLLQVMQLLLLGLVPGLHLFIVLLKLLNPLFFEVIAYSELLFVFLFLES
jgi:hypothetical protein